MLEVRAVGRAEMTHNVPLGYWTLTRPNHLPCSLIPAQFWTVNLRPTPQSPRAPVPQRVALRPLTVPALWPEAALTGTGDPVAVRTVYTLEPPVSSPPEEVADAELMVKQEFIHSQHLFIPKA